jgi:hypothetical protein
VALFQRRQQAMDGRRRQAGADGQVAQPVSLIVFGQRFQDCTPPSRGSGSPSAVDFGSMSLRRITFLFIATCIHPDV